MINSRVFVATLGLLGLLTSVASAGVIGATGATQIVAAPADWHPGVYESNLWVRVFCFECPGQLAQPSAGNVPAPGTYPGLNGSTFSTPTSITYPAGTAYLAYVIHFDPVGKDNLVSLEGSMTFDNPIIYITDSTNDSPLYSALEGGDIVTLSADLRTLTYQLSAGAGGDEMFVVTSVPEPGSLFLVVPMAWVWWLQRRRSR